VRHSSFEHHVQFQCILLVSGTTSLPQGFGPKDVTTKQKISGAMELHLPPILVISVAAAAAILEDVDDEAPPPSRQGQESRERQERTPTYLAGWGKMITCAVFRDLASRDTRVFRRRSSSHLSALCDSSRRPSSVGDKKLTLWAGRRRRASRARPAENIISNSLA